MSFLFAFSQNGHTFITAQLGSNCAKERETTLAPTAEKSGGIFNKRVLPTLFCALSRLPQDYYNFLTHTRHSHNKDQQGLCTPL